MTNNHSNERTDLHLHDDPEHAQMESMLNLLAKQDADAMPAGHESRVLDAVSKAVAPSPLELVQLSQSTGSSKLWSLRYAAAAVLATGTTLIIVGAQPWANTTSNDQSTIALVSLEQDLDAYFALEPMEDGNLSEALTEWDIWAQSVDTDIDSSLTEYEWDEFTSDDGAL